ncbi:hypothetical protein NHQ30_007209 [Ciborinia camelliae]|nr:hypothetical protein NHQ30_007209 [Ciborinia camelliae]
MSVTKCSDFPNNCGQLKADLEIEGVGVYISFLVTALLTLLATVLRFLCQLVLHPHELNEHAESEYHNFDHESEKGSAAILYHAAKKKVRAYRHWIPFRYANSSNHPRYRLLNAALTPLILSLSDQQLVISSAVMIAGLCSWDTISAYHYNIIVFMAWFSTFTHTVALISMSDRILQNRILTGIRLGGYLANFLLFIIAQSRARSFGNTAGLFKTNSSESFSGEAAACLAKTGEREKICNEDREAGLPTTNSQWKHRVNMILKFTHLGKPPAANDQGLRNRISIWADNNSVDHPVGHESGRSGTLQMSSAGHSKLSQPFERQMSYPISPKLFTHESGEAVLLPYSKSTSPTFESVKRSSK